MKRRQADGALALDRLVSRVNALRGPTKPAQQLLQLTRDPYFDLGQAVDCLQRDPALAAHVLRIVNSSFYGQRRDVTNLRQAVVCLGQRSLRLITMTYSLAHSIGTGATKAIYRTYWQRAIAMAVVAARVSAGRRGVDRDDAYSAGLLADLGILVLAQFEASRYGASLQETPHGPALVAAERETFGYSHADVAGRLMQRWEFPQPLVRAVIHHHENRVDAIPLESAVHAGNLMADALYDPQALQVERAKKFVEERFQVDLDGFRELAEASKEDVLECCAALGVQLTQPLDTQALADAAVST